MSISSASDPIQNPSKREEAETAIRAIFDAGCAAWNCGELEGYLASYWNSEKTIWVSSGKLTRGSQAIAEAYKTRFQTPQQMGKLTVADMEVDVLTDQDASVLGHWLLAIDNKTQKGVFTVQLKKIEGEWLFVSDHSSTSE